MKEQKIPSHRTDPQTPCSNCGRVVSVIFVGGINRYAVHNKPNGVQCWKSFDQLDMLNIKQSRRIG